MTDPTASAWPLVPSRAESKAGQLLQLEAKIVALFDRFRHPLLGYLLSFGFDVSDAEEILQEVFLALFQHLKANKAETNLKAWLFRVGHNLALKHRAHLQRNSNGVNGSLDAGAWVVDPSPGPEELLLENQRQSLLKHTFESLPEKDSQCLRLRAEGLRFREIADVLGISLGAVSLSLSRSLARLARAANR